MQKKLWSIRALNTDHPSATQGLLEGWEQGDENQERWLSEAGEYLQVTPGDTAKSAIGNTDQSYSVLNNFRCCLYGESALGHVSLICIYVTHDLSDTYICSYPPASWTFYGHNQFPQAIRHSCLEQSDNRGTGREREIKKTGKEKEKYIWSKHFLNSIYYYFSNAFYHNGGPFLAKRC